MKSDWKKLNKISLNELTKARKQLHQAVQLPAITGRAYHPSVSDDHFASLLWNEELNSLTSQVWGKGFKTAINFKDFSLDLISGSVAVEDSLSLDGKTYNEAFEKLKEIVRNAGEDPNLLKTDLPYEIPVYSTAKSERFKLFNSTYFEELSKYFSIANTILKNVVGQNTEASEISCWPHHFDIATLLVLDGSSENYKSVGVGLSPGDDNYNQPYFYVTPWPYPKTHDMTLPKIPSGSFWHTAGWVGAILTAEKIWDFDTYEEQYKAINEFIVDAIEKSKKLLPL